MKQVSLFSGVGAFELAGERHGVETVYSCELDKHAAKVLKHHFPKTEVFNGDVREVRGRDIVSRYGAIDIITAGFPCQAFSIAGKRKGFADATRGTLFFEVARLADEIRPDYVILENVKGLFSHDGGKTFGVILSRLGELGYDIEWQLLNSKDFGVPQNRERVFIIVHSRTPRKDTKQVFPIRGNVKVSKNSKVQAGQGFTGKHRQSTGRNAESAGSPTTGKGVIPVGQTSSEGSQAGKVYSPEGLMPNICAGTHGYAMGNIDVGEIVGFDGGQQFRSMKSGLSPTLKARAREDGSGQAVMKTGGRIRRLTPVECERLQGFPDGWTDVEQSDTQRYKQCGNSITVNVLEEIYKKL